ncbi:MAG: hypothetical protein J6W47_08265 [Bacteroidales bacterium]|nr:hypothetical protein [Bacteroidales bacterium]
MKTKLPLLTGSMLFLLGTGMFTSCDEDPVDIIYDFAPIVLQVSLSDQEGHNLLDSTSAYAIDLQKVQISMYDQTFQLGLADSLFWQYVSVNAPAANPSDVMQTRMYLAQPFQPFLRHDSVGWQIWIGEFDGADAQNECTIRWNDRDEDRLSYKSTVHYKRNGELKSITRRYYLNGKEVAKTSDGWYHFHIVK